MIEPFPLPPTNQNLTVEDFQRFSRAFADIVSRKIPTAKQVDFVFNEEQLKSSLKNSSVNELVALFNSVCRNGNRCGVHHGFLMIPFTLNDSTIVVVLLSKLDPLFTRRVTEEWLSDIRNEIQLDFLLLKQARIDDQTGILNFSNLYSLLDNPSAGKSVQLTLVEIPSKKSSFQLTTNHLYKCVSALQTFIPDRAIIHHLGNSLFAIIFELHAENDYSQFATSLGAYLKRDGFFPVYVGISHSKPIDSQNTQAGRGRQLLDEAWTSLHVAVKRGPFGFCDFDLLAYPENHPLVRPEPKLIRRLRRLWSKSERFCLVHFRNDNVCCPVDEIVEPLLDRGIAIQSGDDCIVYLDQCEVGAVLKWTENIVRLCRDINSNKTVSAGVSCFPYSDFKKAETVYNCRKALAHAAFYGAGGVALFDAVSLNISGDIYFSDGDLVRAVKEYKRGLKCDEDDVNLHNSLGVTFAMMNKFSAAMNCFEKALKLDENSFMALYNIGLGELHNDKKDTALLYFKRALNSAFEDGSDDRMLKKDLQRQIGILASETGDYQLALDYLFSWYESCNSKRQADRVVFSIGRSYYGLRQNRKAMKWLQRALRSNEYDDRAMNLLGKVYHEEGEGDEIALSLCRKSVELNPNNMEYRLGLACIQFHCGMISDARMNFKKCLKNHKLRAEAQFFLAQCYLEIGHYKRAENWFNKVGAVDGKRFTLYTDLKQRFIKKTS